MLQSLLRRPQRSTKLQRLRVFLGESRAGRGRGWRDSFWISALFIWTEVEAAASLLDACMRVLLSVFQTSFHIDPSSLLCAGLHGVRSENEGVIFSVNTCTILLQWKNLPCLVSLLLTPQSKKLTLHETHLLHVFFITSQLSG